MIKATKLLTLTAILALAACSGGSGGSSGGSGGSSGGNKPASNSIADLAAFAAQGTVTTDSYGVRTASNTYRDSDGTHRVQIKGTADAGLLTETLNGDTLNAQRRLVGAGGAAPSAIHTTGYYTGAANGSLRMSGTGDRVAVSGTGGFSMNAGSGEWGYGVDLWEADGEHGVFVGIDGGTVVGNTMTFDANQSVVVRMTPDGVTNTAERASATNVISADGGQFYGTFTGANAGTGFALDGGISGEHRTDP